MADGKASITEVYRFFAGDGLLSNGTVALPTAEQKTDYPLARFRTEWAELEPGDRTEIMVGIGDGSLTY